VSLTPEELQRRIHAGEGAQLEFKRGLPAPDKVARTLVAFANTRGGLLLIGVDDHGGTPGVQHPEVVTAELTEIAALRVEPALEGALGPRIETIYLAGVPIVACFVGASYARPHAALLQDGTHDVCVRLGSSTRSAAGATLAALRSTPSSEADLKDLERDALAWLGRRGDPVGRPTRPSQARVAGTAEAFAAARNMGFGRARRAFVSLERAGHVIGHGIGRRRVYAPATSGS